MLGLGLHVRTGDLPTIEELMPTWAMPVMGKTGHEGTSKSIPVATGAGFFTPEASSGGNVFHDPKPELRMGALAPADPRDSMSVSSFAFPPRTLDRSDARQCDLGFLVLR